MKRYEIIENEVFTILEKECYGHKLQEAYRHLLGVSELCLVIARKEQLNVELAGIIGILHDLSVYKDHSHFDHANRSSHYAKKILEDCQLFNEDEIMVIVLAIKNHSSKNKTHDLYSELIKLCDVINTYLYEPEAILNQDQQRYLSLAKEKNYI